MVSDDGLRAMIANGGLCPVVSDNGLCSMVSDNGLRPMVSDNGCRAMVADHGTAATVVAVTSRRSFVCGDKGQTSGERDGNSGQCRDTGIHGRLLFFK